MRIIAFLLSGVLLLGCAVWRRGNSRGPAPTQVGVETAVSRVVRYETLAVSVPIQVGIDTLRVRDAVVITRYDTITNRLQVKYVAPSVVERRDTIRQVMVVQQPVPVPPQKRPMKFILPAVIGLVSGIALYLLVRLIARRVFWL